MTINPTLITAVSAVIVSLIAVYASRKKDEASTYADLTSSISTLNKELKDTRANLKKVEDDFRAYKDAIEGKCEKRIQDIVRGYEQQLSAVRISLDEANRRIRELERRNGD